MSSARLDRIRRTRWRPPDFGGSRVDRETATRGGSDGASAAEAHRTKALQSDGLARRRRASMWVTIPVFLLAVAGAGASSTGADWRPVELVVVIAAFSLLNELISFQVDSFHFVSLSAAEVLAMTLLGPAPAVAIGCLAVLAWSAMQRRPLDTVAFNLASYATFLALGAALCGWVAESLDVSPDDLGFAPIVLLGFVAAIFGSGLLTAFANAVIEGVSPAVTLRSTAYVAAELPVAVLTTVTVHAYATDGIAWLGFLAFSQITFQYVLVRLLRLRDHAAKLERQQAVNAALHAETAERGEQIVALAANERRLQAELADAEDREPRTLSEGLHDEVLQDVIAAYHYLGPGGDSQRARAAIDKATAALKASIAALHPRVLEERGLAVALEAAAQEAALRAGFETSVEVSPDAIGEHDKLVYMLARELVTNAAKHAGATKVTIRVTRDDEQVVLAVEDNGRGMPSTRPAEARRDGHIGLTSCATRAEAVGGRVSIDSELGRGTRVRIEFPLAPR